MIRDKLELDYKENIDKKAVEGISMIWNPTKNKLIIEEKILEIINNYNTKKQNIEEFINLVCEEDKEEMINFFNMNLEAEYKKKCAITKEYKIYEDGKKYIIIFLGKIIKSEFDYYLIGTNYSIDLDNHLENYFTDEEVSYRKDVIEKEFVSLINKDLITNLPNIQFFKRKVSRLLKECLQKNKRSALIMLDLDDFKYVNESFDHNFGDLLLKYVSKNILDIVSNMGTVSRYSGDTFLIFVNDINNIEDIANLCNSLGKSFEYPIIINGKSIYLTSSIGIGLFPEHGNDYNTLLKNTDSALHVAKANGKNEINFFDVSMFAELNRVYSLQKGLRTALDGNEIYVMFQPKVSLDDSKVYGFEALARWESREFGLVSPVEFIPIAESTKMIVPIGRFVLEEVFKKIKGLLNEGYSNFKIAVNLSEMQLREDVVILDFKRLIRKYKIPSQYIEVEITESMLMKSFDKNLKILEEIKRLGISIALDDFGTGYSSLNYLTKLPIDVLKIDRSFVIDLISNPKSKCIVETIINLSHKLGIEVVAEGVEDEYQVEYLKTILCDIVQGYYFSKPRMFEQIKEIIGKEIL